MEHRKLNDGYGIIAAELIQTQPEHAGSEIETCHAILEGGKITECLKIF